MFFCLSSFTECTCNVVFSDDDATTVCEGGAFVSQQDYTFDPTSNALVLTDVSNGICQDPLSTATSSDGESLGQTTTTTYTLVEDSSLEFETIDGFMTTFWKTSESVDALPELEPPAPTPVPTTWPPTYMPIETEVPTPYPSYTSTIDTDMPTKPTPAPTPTPSPTRRSRLRKLSLSFSEMGMWW